MTEPNDKEDGDSAHHKDSDFIIESLHKSGKILVENGDTTSLASSFCVSLLQFASSNYETTLNFNDLPLNSSIREWQLLTKHRNGTAASKLNPELKNTTLLQHLDEIFTTAHLYEAHTIYHKIQEEIESYFGNKISLRIIENFHDFKSLEKLNPTTFCILFKNWEQGTFSLVLDYTQRFPNVDSRGEAIIEYLRSCDIFQDYFHNKFSTHPFDAFTVRKEYTELCNNMRAAENVGDVLSSVGISIGSKIEGSQLLKLLMQCENPNLGSDCEYIFLNANILSLSIQCLT